MRVRVYGIWPELVRLLVQYTFQQGHVPVTETPPSLSSGSILVALHIHIFFIYLFTVSLFSFHFPYL